MLIRTRVCVETFSQVHCQASKISPADVKGKKVAVITGTSSGLGLHAAKHLCNSGEWHVIMANRDYSKTLVRPRPPPCLACSTILPLPYLALFCPLCSRLHLTPAPSCAQSSSSRERSPPVNVCWMIHSCMGYTPPVLLIASVLYCWMQRS